MLSEVYSLISFFFCLLVLGCRTITHTATEHEMTARVVAQTTEEGGSVGGRVISFESRVCWLDRYC